MKRMWSKNELKEAVKSTPKDITTLVDAQGHERFVEGDIIANSSPITGLTQTYGKWSLSGTHLLIVLGLSALNECVIPSSKLFKTKDLPKWIYDKVVPLFGTIYVDKKAISLYADNGSSQVIQSFLAKQDNELYLDFGTLTLTLDRQCRVEFDLLIDND